MCENSVLPPVSMCLRSSFKFVMPGFLGHLIWCQQFCQFVGLRTSGPRKLCEPKCQAVGPCDLRLLTSGGGSFFTRQLQSRWAESLIFSAEWQGFEIQLFIYSVLSRVKVTWAASHCKPHVCSTPFLCPHVKIQVIESEN